MPVRRLLHRLVQLFDYHRLASSWIIAVSVAIRIEEVLLEKLGEAGNIPPFPELAYDSVRGTSS